MGSGEWTDDTSMAVAIAEVTAADGSLRGEAALDMIARQWAGPGPVVPGDEGGAS